ncbi:MAG TPA: UDP-N-acetylmuramoyl-tripeptide--D-alanyl-D-alanine ligase [Candidatus Dormibacteraeota bacterium]|jgi:UDP-N-acetylmuramoyl-tripeptide--D-alanyl-D-alanine ligase|nr:UDP-N-acetylmuramoyl-tripeptide--D-alanyl-D-alanine ligase [Candidatus Dormibacteraeota bacterium]
MSFTLAELVEATGGRLVGGPPGGLTLERLVTDSRQAAAGALFVALAGEATDGHRFVPEAIAAGASALLLAREQAGVEVPQVVVSDTRVALARFTRARLAAHRVRVVGVTGSVGKTSTKEMLAAVLGPRFVVLKTEGNLNTYTGFPITVAGLAPEHQVFVAEYAMSARGEIAFLCEMAPPEVGVVLNVGWSHAGMLGGIDAVAEAKRELVEALPAAGLAVLNADDPRVVAMASASAAPVVFYGLGEGGAPAWGQEPAWDRPPGPAGPARGSGPDATGRPPAVTAEDVRLGGLAGTEMTLVTPSGRARLRLHVPGRHAVSNALAAAAVGDHFGISPEDTAGALEGFRPLPGRLVARAGREGSVILDDSYNASPASMEAALAVLLADPHRPRIAVLGDMLELGDATVEAHRSLGRAAAGVDLLIAVGEHAGAIREGAVGEGMEPDRVFAVASREAAAEIVGPQLEGSIVLVKASRGVALEEVVSRLVAQP